jgi:hypothetical protein
MQVLGRLPGFRYIWGTTDPDVCVVRVRYLLIYSKEWVVDRRRFAETHPMPLLNLPMYLVENGTAREVEVELQRWAFPFSTFL